VFQPGETVELPVVFYVDPELASDRDTFEVQQITLSYTYFEQPKKAAAAGRDVASPRLGAKGDAG
jgi:cytochrome c oxidase assembly protein subunit 11